MNFFCVVLSKIILISLSLNHFVRSGQHAWRNRQSNLLRRLQIDHKLKFRWLLDRQICRLRAFQDFVDHRCGAPVGLGLVGAVGHQTAALDKITTTRYRREAIFPREVRNQFLIRIVERAPRHDDSATTSLRRFFEARLEFVCAAYFH
jgi:hypothetical protein